jgi:DNA polymerase
MLERKFGLEIHLSSWFDPMALSRYLCLPGSLGGCAAALELPVQKDKRGKDLIKRFSSPSKSTAKEKKAGAPDTYWANSTTHPEDWAAFLSYAGDDVDALRAAVKEMESYTTLPASEALLWRFDQALNDRGLPVDHTYVSNAKRLMSDADAETLASLTSLTKLENVNSPAQIKTWLEQQGFPMPSIAAPAVTAALAGELPPQVREALMLRERQSGAGPKKLATIQAMVSADGRLRHQYVYYGAHTGRWASRGVQVHNLPRPEPHIADRDEEITDAVRAGYLPADLDPAAAITGTIRSAFRAHEGYQLVISDYASIENRVLAWLAQSPAMLNVFKHKRDPYKSFAMKVFGIAYDAVTKQQRTLCKPAVLGAGFAMGGVRLADYAKSMGVALDEVEAKEHIAVFRHTYPEVPALWSSLQSLAFSAVRDRLRLTSFSGLVFDARDPRYLSIQLPSGRSLFYLKPTVATVIGQWGSREMLTFETAGKGGMYVEHSHGGKLCENIVQAVARDILAFGLLSAHRAGYYVIGHTHDEIIAEQPAGSAQDAAFLERIMSTPPKWALDLPLAAEAHTSQFYSK